MPYITCNGQIFSRYDQSPKVQDCIKAENNAQQIAYTECMNDPVCKDAQEVHDNIVIGGFGVILLLWLIIAGICIATIHMVSKSK